MKFVLHKIVVVLYVPFFVFGVLLLPGCGALIDWSKDAMYQGHEKEISVRTARSFIRSVAVYDQFALLGKFDALWLSDDVRATFARMYALKWGKSQTQAETFVARQQEENRQLISFYVLYPFDQVPLGMIDSMWSTFLQIDGANEKTYAPLEIRTIDLSPEYQKIFGPVATRFKQAYQINFDAKDRDDQPLITPQTRHVSLCFRSVIKEVSLSWHMSDSALVSGKRIDRLVRPIFDSEIVQAATKKSAHEKKRAKSYAHRTHKKDTHHTKMATACQSGLLPAGENSAAGHWAQHKKNRDIEELV